MVRGHSLTCRLAVGLYSVYDVVLVTSGAAAVEVFTHVIYLKAFIV